MISQGSKDNITTPRHRPKLVIAGASGSIGTAVCRELADDYEIVALTRSLARSKLQDKNIPVTWQFCDFFSMRGVEAALAGIEFSIYLIHTRIPTARLDQAQSEDMDLLLADNFARAAKKNGIKQIVYLGGIIPEGAINSPLIQGDKEIVEVLSSSGTAVTTLRASLIVGPGSSIVNLLANIVRSSPFVLVPRWALTRKQPIALTDVLRAIRSCLGNKESFGKDYDIGGKTIMNFREIMKDAAEVLGKKRIILVLPILPRRLYFWWIRLLDRNAHPGLVRLMIEAIQYDDVVAKNNPLQEMLVKDAMPARQALEPHLEGEDKKLPLNPRSAFQGDEDSDLQLKSRVRSIQRLRLPRGRNAAWVADYYFQWLSRLLHPFALSEVDDAGSCNVYVRVPRLRILGLTFRPDHSTPGRRMYFITGGILAKVFGSRGARLEFRDILSNRFTIVAIHDFRPSLPWFFYVATQAVIHKIVMSAFQRHMARLADQAQ
ncbi:MAG: NAD(P)H-binding protein [Candidatus Scalindua sp.]